MKDFVRCMSCIDYRDRKIGKKMRCICLKKQISCFYISIVYTLPNIRHVRTNQWRQAEAEESDDSAVRSTCRPNGVL
jgi:hypothetical protein